MQRPLHKSARRPVVAGRPPLRTPPIEEEIAMQPRHLLCVAALALSAALAACSSVKSEPPAPPPPVVAARPRRFRRGALTSKGAI